MKFLQIIHITFFTLAPIYNAVMDTLVHHFGISLFKKFNEKWWNPNVSFTYVKPFFGTRLDAWHVAKMGMLFSFSVSIATYTVIINPIIDIFIHLFYGGLIFELFYSYILAKKKNFYRN